MVEKIKILLESMCADACINMSKYEALLQLVLNRLEAAEAVCDDVWYCNLNKKTEDKVARIAIKEWRDSVNLCNKGFEE